MQNRKKPGRKPRVSDTEGINVLSKLKNFNSGELKKLDLWRGVWKEATDLLHNKIIPISLCLRVKKSRQGIEIHTRIRNKVVDNYAINR